MNTNIIGIIVSVVFIFFIIFISSLVSKKHSEVSRKIVHIGVCNWWIIVMLLFDNVIYASTVPVLFVVVNYLSYKKDIFKSMERDDKKSLGTVYYAISCLVLTLFSFLWFNDKMHAGIGLFAMGYGDGLAALIGTRFKSKEFKIFGNKKSLLGCITMFVVCMIVISITTLCFGQFSILKVVAISLIATIIEALSPMGLDTLTVPILTTIISYYMF